MFNYLDIDLFIKFFLNKFSSVTFKMPCTIRSVDYAFRPYRRLNTWCVFKSFYIHRLDGIITDFNLKEYDESLTLSIENRP